LNGHIVGLDLFPGEVTDPRISIYKGRQNDLELLDKISLECAPQGFDIIIDDCAHIGELAKISFWHMFENHLKPGGIYAVEDWGTGYWGKHIYYPDGAFYNPHEPETFAHRIANRLLKFAPVEWPKMGPLQRILRRYQFTRRFKGHDYGMVGFVKQFIDEIGIAEITNPNEGVARPKNPPEPQKQSRFNQVIYTPGVVLIFKNK
jgi:hypothetical protein